MRAFSVACCGVALVTSSFAAEPVAADQGQPNVAPAITTVDLATLRDLGGLSVSPDGKWVVFQVRQAQLDRNRYDLGWWVARTSGAGPARRVTDAGEPILPAYQGRINGSIVIEPPTWSPDGEWFIYVRQDQDELQVWRSRRDGSRNEQVTHLSAAPGVPVFSRDGSRIFFATVPSRRQLDEARIQEGLRGFHYDRRFLPIYSPQPLQPLGLDFSAGGMTSALIHATEGLVVHELDSGVERLATAAEKNEFLEATTPAKPTDRPGLRDLIARSKKGAWAWVEARDPSQHGPYALQTIGVQPARGAPVLCEHPEGTANLFKGLWWRGEDEVVFARGEGPRFHHTALYAWKPGLGAPRLILRTPDLFMNRSDMSAVVANGRLVCFYESANAPRRLVAIDLDTGKVVTLFDPNPEFARFKLAEPEEWVFRTASGVETFGYLVRPRQAKEAERLPLVITTYRASGFLRGGMGDEYPVFPLAENGFAVLCFNTPDPDLRRSSAPDSVEYQKWARGPGDPEKRQVQEALDTVVEQLAAKGLIDPERVGLTGLSFGAETVRYALFSMPHLAAAIASSAGSDDPGAFFLYGRAARDLLRSWGFGPSEGIGAARWQAVSLSANAAKVRAPLLLQVSDHEMLAALQTVTALEEARKPVEMYVFPDEFHFKWQPRHRIAIYDRNVDWMNFWLRQVEDASPQKAEQYVRWRKLRELRDTDLPGRKMKRPPEIRSRDGS